MTTVDSSANTSSHKLQGKVALVTGGSTGIGLGIARRFAREGAFVFVTGRRQAELEAAVKELGPRVRAVRSDVASLADLDALYATIAAAPETREAGGKIDIVVANAGGGSLVPLGAITEEHYDSIFDVNVKGVLFTVQKALPLLRDGGAIVLTGSTTGVKGTPAFSVYSATKAAVRNFARSWVLDLKERKIRVNVLSPGPIETPGLHGIAPNDEVARQIKEQLAASVPLARLGHVDEVAGAALFLASDDASFVNGAELFVDGGMAQI